MTKFSAAQRQAIEHKDGPMMVIAGPGSGKTAVLTQRICHLVNECRIAPGSILVITFTRAAAREMEERYSRLVRGKRLNGVTFGTFHSVFLRILKDYGKDAGALKLIEEKEAVLLLREQVLKRSPGAQYTGDYYDHMLQEIGRIKNGMEPDDPDVPELMRLYDTEMRRRGLIDFDDMLIRCRELISSDPRILAGLRKKYTYIMVDEFQDINPVQFDIIRLIAEPLNNLFIVGDDDQSIYAFRGSDPSIMLSFADLYPGASVVELSLNYRSSGNIVRASAKLIRHNKNRFHKHLRTSHEKGPKLKYTAYRDAYDEAEGVIRFIAGLPDHTSVGVLFRTHRAGNVFLQMINAMKENSEAFSRQLQSKTIQPMTFHASKGLEFDAVCIIRAEETVTPAKTDAGGTGDSKSIEEERRMFYVAMTRAKLFLHISYTKYSYNKKNRRSRFVREALGIRWPGIF